MGLIESHYAEERAKAAARGWPLRAGPHGLIESPPPSTPVPAPSASASASPSVEEQAINSAYASTIARAFYALVDRVQSGDLAAREKFASTLATIHSARAVALDELRRSQVDWPSE